MERNNFRSFYRLKKPFGAAHLVVTQWNQGKPKEKYQEEIITKSLMSLIDRGFAIGYGRRTPCKWFITHIKLTRSGVKEAALVLESRQRKLPF